MATAMAGVGRLRRIMKFPESRSWKIERNSRVATHGLGCELTQSAMSGRMVPSLKAAVRRRYRPEAEAQD